MYAHDLIWLDLEIVRLNEDARLAADLLTDLNVAGEATLVLELYELGLLLAHRDELEVDHGLELDVGRRHQSV